jgi:hypothetical protein
MKVEKTTFKTETACHDKISESLVEGRLSLPPDKADIARILFIHGKVHLNAEPADGKIFMDGSALFCVVYMDMDGNIDAFESSSPFRHSEDMANAGAGMNVYAKGAMKEIDYTVEDGHSVYVKGIVSFRITGSTAAMHDAMSAAASPDMQVKMMHRKMPVTKDYIRHTAVMKEDVRVPQSMPRADRILFSDAYAVVGTVKTEELKVIVEGHIKMMVVYLSEDKNAPLQYFYESIPFGEILSTENAADGSMIMADADMFDVSVDIAEAESDILRLYAKLNIICAVKSYNDIALMEDAYSLKKKLDVSYCTCAYSDTALSGCAKMIARCTISIPESRPAASRIVCMKACPVIATVTPYTDRAYIDGMMMFTVCYTSQEGMQSYSGDVPFEAEIQMEGLLPAHDVRVDADVEYCSFEGVGREISVKIMMDARIKAYTQNSFRLVSDLTETDEAVQSGKGLTIYFADGGESIWDIAKRYATTQDAVSQFNPDIGEQTQPGQKILIIG